MRPRITKIELKESILIPYKPLYIRGKKKKLLTGERSLSIDRRTVEDTNRLFFNSWTSSFCLANCQQQVQHQQCSVRSFIILILVICLRVLLAYCNRFNRCASALSDALTPIPNLDSTLLGFSTFSLKFHDALRVISASITSLCSFKYSEKISLDVSDFIPTKEGWTNLSLSKETKPSCSSFVLFNNLKYRTLGARARTWLRIYFKKKKQKKNDKIEIISSKQWSWITKSSLLNHNNGEIIRRAFVAYSFFL